MFEVYRTASFEKELKKQFSREEQKQVERFEQKQLVETPFVGDPLGNRFFREKKVGGKRVYYLVYETLNVVLMVAVSDKSTQQATIDVIQEHLAEYQEIVKSALKQRGESDRV